MTGTLGPCETPTFGHCLLSVLRVLLSQFQFVFGSNCLPVGRFPSHWKADLNPVTLQNFIKCLNACGCRLLDSHLPTEAAPSPTQATPRAPARSSLPQPVRPQRHSRGDTANRRAPARHHPRRPERRGLGACSCPLLPLPPSLSSITHTVAARSTRARRTPTTA